MPEISRFYGIIIRMYYDDHAPPHFHAIYAEHEIVVGISPIEIREGDAPNRVKSMVMEWAAMHQQELLDDWACCRDGRVPHPITPLD